MVYNIIHIKCVSIYMSISMQTMEDNNTLSMEDRLRISQLEATKLREITSKLQDELSELREFSAAEMQNNINTTCESESQGLKENVVLLEQSANVLLELSCTQNYQNTNPKDHISKSLNENENDVALVQQKISRKKFMQLKLENSRNKEGFESLKDLMAYQLLKQTDTNQKGHKSKSRQLDEASVRSVLIVDKNL